MKILSILTLTILLNTIIHAAQWTAKTDFGGVARKGATSFSIGSIGYLGTGDDDAGNYYNDFWAFDPSNNTWTQKLPVPGGGRRYAIGFTAGGKGYIGLGSNATTNLRDIYEYDPTGNTWTGKTSLPNTAIIAYETTSFAINDKGYFLSGQWTSTPLKMEFWEFDPAGMGTWTEKAPLAGGGVVRRGPSGFTLDGLGYIGLGADENSSAHAEMWAYNPINNTWTAKASVPSIGAYAVGFATSTNGFMGIGVNGIQKKLYKYIPGSPGSWVAQDDFPGQLRYHATAFAIGDMGYIGTGQGSLFKDFFAFDPAVVLPIELQSFNAQLNGHKRQVNVQWETASESDNAYFSVERKTGDSDFQAIGQMKSRGNSTQLSVYNLVDKNPQKGISYYRLKQVNSDNTFTYSKIVNVTSEKRSKINIFPTYTEGPIFVDSNNEPLNDISVFTLSGQLSLKSRENNLNLSALPTGVYLVQVTMPNKEQITTKIFKK
jgi:N-acetylneuraminic acid mutarotase